MNNKFTIDQITKSESIDPKSINRLYKLNMMLNFMEIRSNNPRMTQKQICIQIGTSDSTNKHYRNDIAMDSPYNRNNYKKKKPKKSPDTKTVIDESSKNKIIEKRINNKPKVEKRGGYLEDRRLTGKELFEKAFNATINHRFN